MNSITYPAKRGFFTIEKLQPDIELFARGLRLTLQGKGQQKGNP